MRETDYTRKHFAARVDAGGVLHVEMDGRDVARAIAHPKNVLAVAEILNGHTERWLTQVVKDAG